MRSSTLLLLAAVVFPACGQDDEPTGGSPGPTGTSEPPCYALSDGRCAEETFRNPPVLEPDGDGVYHLALEATEVTLAGQRHCVRAYNGSYPGPTIDTPARAGSEPRSVRVDLSNRLRGHSRPSEANARTTAAAAP